MKISLLSALFICTILAGLRANTTELPQVATGLANFIHVMEVIDQQARLQNADSDITTISKALMAELVSNPDAYNLLTEKNGRLQLSEENAFLVLSRLKESVKEKSINVINKGLGKYYDYKEWGSEKYDKFQAKLDEKMPLFRDKIADILSIINGGLSSLDPALISTILAVASEIIGAVSSILGAAFGVPVIPGLALSLLTLIFANQYAISSYLAGAKTLLDIAEIIIRPDSASLIKAKYPGIAVVEPDAVTDEQKGNALKKIASLVKWVAEDYAKNYATYQPEQVEFVRKAIFAIGGLFGYFL